MPDIHVQHVIFTRVERMYSPRRISGYQIVYQSPSLGRETLQIEKRLQCFQPNGQPINRYQFFWTENDQAVLTKSVPLLRPDREIIDRDQRDAFLAHALVLSKKEFALVRNDPFAIFDAARQINLFIETEKQLVAHLNQVPPRELLKVPIREKQTWYFFENWPTSELCKLFELGLQAPLLLKQKQSLLLLTGDLDEIYLLLSNLLPLLPPHERAACTFDTFVGGCLPSVSTFWAVGNTRQVSNTGFLPIRLAERRVTMKAPDSSLDPEATLYSSWLLYTLKSSGLKEINEEVFSAQMIAEAFLEHKPLPEKLPNERALEHFYEANAQFIHNILLQIVTAFFALSLAEEVVDVLKSSLPLRKVVSIAAQATYSAHELAWVIYYWRLNESTQFEYWYELFNFADQAADAPLILMTSLKSHPKKPFLNQEKLRDKSVHYLIMKDKLVPVVNDLLGMQKRLALFAKPQHSSSATQSESSSKGFQLTDDEFLTLVFTLLRNDAGHILGDSFVKRVALLRNPKVLREMTKAVNKVPDVPKEFIRALKQHP